MTWATIKTCKIPNPRFQPPNMSELTTIMVGMATGNFFYGIYFNLFVTSTYLLVNRFSTGKSVDVYRSMMFVSGVVLFLTVTAVCPLLRLYKTRSLNCNSEYRVDHCEDLPGLSFVRRRTRRILFGQPPAHGTCPGSLIHLHAGQRCDNGLYPGHELIEISRS